MNDNKSMMPFLGGKEEVTLIFADLETQTRTCKLGVPRESREWDSL